MLKGEGRPEIFKIERLKTFTSQGNHFRKCLQGMFPHKWGRQESREIKESVSEKRGKSREDYLDHLPRRQRRLPDEPSGERENSCNL